MTVHLVSFFILECGRELVSMLLSFVLLLNILYFYYLYIFQNDFPAIKDFWDLIYKSKYLKMPAFTSLLTELYKASERVLNLLREHDPRPKSLPHANLISAIKELMKTFVHHTTLHPNKVKTPKHGFLKFRM